MVLGGYLLVIRDHERQGRLGQRIESAAYFTDTITVNNWQGNLREIAFISLDGETIGYVCLVERKRLVATYRMLLHFSKFFTFSNALPFESVRLGIDPRVRRYFERLIEAPDGGWLTPATWNEVIRVISDLQPEIIGIIAQLEALRIASRETYSRASFDVLAEEKDAYTSIIRYAGFEDTAESSVVAWEPTTSKTDSIQSFIASISSYQNLRVTEDQAIDYDASRFGDWKVLRQFVTGERIFHKDKEALLIRNVNRQQLEHTLGVDLIYFNYTYRSFVLVQYKRMLREEDYCYRPDAQFYTELGRMRTFETETAKYASMTNSLSDYRLNPGAFYFKFHEDDVFDPIKATLIKGMHVPLGYWNLFEQSPQARGPRGGLIVGYNNMGRYLNNTEFEAFVSKGLIGSTGLITDLLTKIVQPLVFELNHSVTVGIKV